MTDMRRTILWVVFTMSLVLLWDAWNKHNGQPGFFGVKPPVAAPATAAAGSAPALPGALPAPAAVPGAVPGALAASAAAPTAPVNAAAPKSEQVTVTTDRVKATFDTQGGSLVKLELLDFRDPVDAKNNVLLMDQSAKRLYAAQTGLVTGQAGVTLPNHFTLMNVVPGERTLAAGAADVSIRFESPVVDGVKLAKTYTLKRGDYTMAVKHEVINQGTAAVSPQL